MMTDGFRPVARLRGAEYGASILQLFALVFGQFAEVTAERVEATIEPGQLSGFDPDPKCVVTEADQRGIAPTDEPLVVRSVVPMQLMMTHGPGPARL